MAEPQAPKLPDDAPQDVKDFFDCKGDKLVWKKGKVTWLGLGVDPDVTFEHGSKPGVIDITVTVGSPPFGIKFKLPASVNANGDLEVNTSDIPDLSGISDKLPGKQGVDDAIKNINDWFKKNGKKLKGATLKGGSVTLEKTAVAVAPGAGKAAEEKPKAQEKPKAPVIPPTGGKGKVSYEPDAYADTIALGPVVAAGLVPMNSGARHEARSRSGRIAQLFALVLAVVALGALFGFAFLGGPAGPAAVAQVSQPPTAVPSAAQSAAPSVVTSSSPGVAASVTPSPTLTVAPPPPPTQTAAIGYFEKVCGRVVHEAIANYISQIQWLIEWSGTPVDHFDLVIDGANDGHPVTFSFDPETGEWLGNSGLDSAGDKVIIGFSAHLADGGHVDLTQEFIDYLGDDTITVRFPQEDSVGDCASPTP